MIIENRCSVWHYETTQTQHCDNNNNYNDGNVMYTLIIGPILLRHFDCEQHKT
jgi:hypothetical protein